MGLDAYTVTCPDCGARPSEPCRDLRWTTPVRGRHTIKVKTAHYARQLAAEAKENH